MESQLIRQRIYIETTIVSYLTSKPSRDRIVAGRQAATELWWRLHRPKCDLFVSEVVALEAHEGDPDASRRREAAIAGIPLLAVTEEVSDLAKRLVSAHALPTTAEDDALHVALASVFEMDVLLTWNCRHIANVIAMPIIRATIEEAGYESPTITTPSDLLESLGEIP